MNALMTNEHLQSRYAGLSLYKARKNILRDFSELEEHQIDICYEESDYPKFTVLDCRYDDVQKKIMLKIASLNPIRHLPSNYQNNDFLRGFLMIFQHIMNETSSVLDNMHEYFRPMESPQNVLPVLADWLGIHLEMFRGEDEVRRFLQCAIPLYRYRGTAIGLKAHLSIVTNIVPEIIEDANPFSAMVIHEQSEVDAKIFEREKGENSFIIYFDKERNYFDDELIHRISHIVQQEKPVYTKAFIAFKKSEKQKRKITVIENNKSMNTDGVIFI
jgi:phage tail-like protein